MRDNQKQSPTAQHRYNSPPLTDWHGPHVERQVSNWLGKWKQHKYFVNVINIGRCMAVAVTFDSPISLHFLLTQACYLLIQPGSLTMSNMHNKDLINPANVSAHALPPI